MNDMIKTIYDSEFDETSKEFEEYIINLSKEFDFYIPPNSIHPYVSYSFFWMNIVNDLHLFELLDDETLEKSQKEYGIPLFKNEKLKELYTAYDSDGYTDLINKKNDLKNDLKEVNQLIYGYIQNTILQTADKISSSNRLFRPNSQSDFLFNELINWALKLMYKFVPERYENNPLSVFGEDLNQLREDGAQIKYKIYLIDQLLYKKRHQYNYSFHDHINVMKGHRKLELADESLKKLAEEHCKKPNTKYKEDEVLFVLTKAKEYKDLKYISDVISNIQNDRHCPESMKDSGDANASKKHERRQRKIINIFDEETQNVRK